MFTKFKLSDIQLGEVKVGGVEIEFNYSVNEMNATYELTKKAIKELPEMLKDIRESAMVIREVEKEFEDLEMQDYQERMVKKELRRAINKSFNNTFRR